mgnify:CR=1 FL=1
MNEDFLDAKKVIEKLQEKNAFLKEVLDEESINGFFSQAEKVIEIIETEILPNYIKPEHVSIMKILTFLGDGKPHAWKDLKKNVKLSTRTISKTLKLLVENGFVTRTIKPSFPPQTLYQITEKATSFIDVFSTLRSQGKIAIFISILFWNLENGGFNISPEGENTLKDMLKTYFYNGFLASISLLAKKHREEFIILPSLGYTPTIPTDEYFGFVPNIILNYEFWVTAICMMIYRKLKLMFQADFHTQTEKSVT